MVREEGKMMMKKIEKMSFVTKMSAAVATVSFICCVGLLTCYASMGFLMDALICAFIGLVGGALFGVSLIILAALGVSKRNDRVEENAAKILATTGVLVVVTAMRNDWFLPDIALLGGLTFTMVTMLSVAVADGVQCRYRKHCAELELNVAAYEADTDTGVEAICTNIVADSQVQQATAAVADQM